MDAHNHGTVLPIRLVGDPVLHRPCRPVTAFDDSLARLVEDMFASVYAAEGVGLAANQIGVDLQVFVYHCPDGDNEFQKGVVVNPTLVMPDAGNRRLDVHDEGCLSVPGQRASLARPDRAVAHGYDVHGAPITVLGTGVLARCLQHETDHLEGRLYIDRLPADRRRQVLDAYEQVAGTPVRTPES
ncbi:peptide deformylase 4 [Sphaerisporangium siamense]|uniref:Peptide deformylase n=1 Tax=Sphaerisporangium siamense TaxID=795645 RepID=A0A7W7D3L1_9ACTN|nr:peptide deformylase [Sphaerisporangium siamense]MBB4699349.1 peptide deformylase [Sphaerisporangium siamense]GII89260.1 peptide deformylase 4 [Sphaerisporangium siamense]